jgi:iron complex outermembrane receptor protein
VYIQEEWRPVSGLTLRGGFRFADIKNTIILESINIPQNNVMLWNKLLWSAGAKYSVSERTSLYINSGSSFSTPGLKSMGGTILLSDQGVSGRNGQLPNPNLKPETGIGTDAGVDFDFPGNFKVGVRGFYTILKNGIIDNVVSQNPSQTQSINSKSSAAGGEIEISHKISSIFTWYVNGTYMKTVVKNELNNDQNNSEIPFSPNLVLNAGFTVNTNSGLIIAPSINYNGGFYDGISKNDRIKYVPGVVLNSYIAQQIVKTDSYKLDSFIQLYNITNNVYSMPWQFKNTGMSGTIGLRVNF